MSPPASGPFWTRFLRSWGSSEQAIWPRSNPAFFGVRKICRKCLTVLLVGEIEIPPHYGRRRSLSNKPCDRRVRDSQKRDGSHHPPTQTRGHAVDQARDR